MERRDFLKAAAVSGAVTVLDRFLPTAAMAEYQQAASSSNAPSLLKRAYGKGGIQLSIIGLAGLMLRHLEQNAANRVVADSFERGVNYYDVAPAYGDAEIKLGPALEPYRKKVFLACKTQKRTREGAEAELKRSLERLKTDYFDLYQLHFLVDLKKDVEVAFSKGGAMEALLEAKKEGRVRHLGFSAHTVEAALAAMERFEFDSIVFPFNFASYLKANFGPQVMKKAQELGVTRVAMKACIRSKWASEEERKKDSKYGYLWYQPLSNPREAELGLRFSLSQPIMAALPPQDEGLYRQAVDIAMRFKPLTPQEEGEVKAMAVKIENPLFPETRKA
jgi:aryl-alcohol dehydrogenase-like predicted oxidoreductase